ncbi:hypothetical protein BGAL_0356g00050 [Botrytis galanthina]|uniref:Uncharacterized protein n=1 Tax=Botrytis galanthina TaxID=278940 RepID=A0A4S8QQ51_9HELO|nr:hypothetical protein BGAL_0356g00050 [Botrytis galanthina]
MVTPWLASSAPRAATATPASAESEITPLLASPRPDETEAEAEAGVRYEPISGRIRGSTVEDGNGEPPESPLGLPPDSLSLRDSSVMGHPVKILRRGSRFDWSLQQKVIITNFIITNGFSKEQCGQNKKEQVSSQQLNPLLAQLDFARFTSMKNDIGDLITDIIEEKLRTRLWKSHEGKGNVDKVHRDAILKGELLTLEEVNGVVVAVPIGSAGPLHHASSIPSRSSFQPPQPQPPQPQPPQPQPPQPQTSQPQPSHPQPAQPQAFQPPQTQNVNQISDQRPHPTINSSIHTNSSTIPTNSTTVSETSARETPLFSDPFAHLTIEEKYQMRQEYMKKRDEQRREEQKQEQIQNPSLSGMQSKQLQTPFTQDTSRDSSGGLGTTLLRTMGQVKRAATGAMARILEEEELPSSSFAPSNANIIGVGDGSGLSTGVHGPRPTAIPATISPRIHSLGLEHQILDQSERQSSPSQSFERLSIHDTPSGNLTEFREQQQQHQSSISHTQPLDVVQVLTQTHNHSTRPVNSLDGTTPVPSYTLPTNILGALRDLQPAPQGFGDQQIPLPPPPPPPSHRYGYNSSPALGQNVNGNPSAVPQGHGDVNPSAVPQGHGNVNPSAVPQGHGNVNPSAVPQGHGNVNPSAVPQGHSNVRPSTAQYHSNVNPYAVPQYHGNVNPFATPQYHNNANSSTPQGHGNVNPPAVPQGHSGFNHLGVPQYYQSNSQYPGYNPYILPYSSNPSAAPQYGTPLVPQQYDGFNPPEAPQHHGGVGPSGVHGYYGSNPPAIPQYPGYNPHGVHPHHQNFNHSGINTPATSPANFPTSIHAIQKTYKHDYARDKAALEDYRRNLRRKERDRKFKFVEEVVREARNDDDDFKF